ncbi:EamA family transporter [Nocardioides bruguierae]|uniref:DMT family transporter n=1 Tax=Nocardioides bruguierae TaxID=2945102 RepID=A0A9X2IER5_9ACTN|nr:EamA family transporter [Nocardioides bruguierae]MCM0620572.1 DMT family transporter [Nocardioides bruguierae]
MTRSTPTLLPPARLPLLPAAAFVVVWSSGYIAAPVGVDLSAPIALLVLRFGVATLMLGGLALALRGRPRFSRADLLRVAATGLLINAAVFALMYEGFEIGLPATLAALLHSLSPVLTALLATLLLRERLRPVQVIGFAAGVVGVLVVLGPDVWGGGASGTAVSPTAVLLGLGSLLCLTLGTLGQRWTGEVDPVWSATVQCAVSVPPLLVLMVATEGLPAVESPGLLALDVLWLAGINSVAGLLLLGRLVRAGGAGAAASLFFLMPPVTAVAATLLLDEPLGLREVVGLLVGAAGVAIATGAVRLPRRGGRQEP